MALPGLQTQSLRPQSAIGMNMPNPHALCLLDSFVAVHSCCCLLQLSYIQIVAEH